MSNSRELAEQAFSLLQDALRHSETRVAELDAELKKKRAPKDKLEEQVSVLEHRLSAAETEKLEWQRQAQQFEEILESERAKLRQIRKKLEIAESGPDRVEKREINFWRTRVEQHDAEIEQFKQRIAELEQALEQSKADLDVERECTANVSELANERREQITELSEKLDEIQERYEEAKWNLGRASRFERMIKRRRSIVANLIQTVRMKQKSNVALKAGLDGLRKFKAKAEQQQQKLLVQIDELTIRLRATEKKLADQRSLAESKDSTICELKAEIELQTSDHQAINNEAVEDAMDATAIRERDSLIGDLNRQIADQQKEINRLNKEISGWQKKYEFLSTDLPSNYAKQIGRT